METLARVRRGGKQKVVVEHVNVDSGGKAAVGTFVQQQPGGGGDEFEIEGQAHAIPSPSSQGRCGARTWNADRPCRSWRVTGVAGCTAAPAEVAHVRAPETVATKRRSDQYKAEL